jgi:hypothetical protein
MLSFRMRIAHKASWYGADSEERTTVESIKGADSTDSIYEVMNYHDRSDAETSCVDDRCNTHTQGALGH